MPCLSGPAPPPTTPYPSATKSRATGPEWLWVGLARDPPVTPSTRRRLALKPSLGRAAGVTNTLAMPPQLFACFIHVMEQLPPEARRPRHALHPWSTPAARLGRPTYPAAARRSRQVPPRAKPQAAWLTSLTTRTGWVAPATGMGKWGVGAKPRPQTPTPRPCVCSLCMGRLG